MTKKTNEKKTEKKHAEEIKQEDTNSVNNISEQENHNETEKEGTEKTIETLENEIADLKDKHLRLFSEFDNFRRRTTKERIELFKTAHSDLIIDLLPILDDFDRAVKSFEETKDASAIKEGVDLIKNKFEKTLEKKGLKCMKSHGKDFDTDFHEAITEIPAPTKDLKSKVVDVIEKGYTLNEKVIRYAKVIVGK